MEIMYCFNEHVTFENSLNASFIALVTEEGGAVELISGGFLFKNWWQKFWQIS